jgi:hypothetical protein
MTFTTISVRDDGVLKAIGLSRLSLQSGSGKLSLEATETELNSGTP